MVIFLSRDAPVFALKYNVYLIKQIYLIRYNRNLKILTNNTRK